MSEGFHIRIAQDGHEALFGLRVLQQLRPDLDEDHFIEIIDERIRAGYHFAMLLEGSGVVAVAGYRYGVSFAWGRYVFVEDLVADESVKGQGFRRGLLGFLKEQARHHNCRMVRIDSRNERNEAHALYEEEGFEEVGKAFCWAYAD